VPIQNLAHPFPIGACFPVLLQGNQEKH